MTPRPPHIARLVQAMVEARLAPLSGFRGFVLEDDNERPGTGRDLDDLIEALEVVQDTQFIVPAEFRDFEDRIWTLSDKAEGLLLAMRNAATEAGFLIGLELGQRLRGGR